MTSSLKRPSVDAAEVDGGGLVKLVHSRVVDVEKLVSHVKILEDELAEARGELDQALKVLDLVRAGKLGAQNRNPASRREGASVSGKNGEVSGEAHPASASLVEKPSAPAGARHSAPHDKSPGKDRGQEKSKKRTSGAGLEGKSKKAKGGVQREHLNLISMIKSQNERKRLDVGMLSYIALQHKRKPRSLLLSPTIDHLFATSALDGVVNFWQVTQENGFGLNLSHTVNLLSPAQKRWPEDLAWHPLGETLFGVYTGDGGPQIGVISTSKKKPGIKFLKDKPHEKGIINNIQFLPSGNGSQFVTGGCDHGVVLWTEKEKGWKPHILHRTLHTSSVTGMDKRLMAVDPSHGGIIFRQTVDSKALALAPNPADHNLFMVHIGSPGKQLRLFDIRAQGTELHCFGWKQNASDSQSQYISQSWSPDGWYCVSGSADPKIHVYDIRFNSEEPLQTLVAHQKKVFKAAWHSSLPLLLSISSDLNIGLHKLGS